MKQLQELSRNFRGESKLAQKALRALASLSDSDMFPGVFELSNLDIFADVMKCGDLPMVQWSLVILLNLAKQNTQYRASIHNMQFEQYVFF